VKKEIKYTIISILSLFTFFGIWHLITGVLKVVPSYTMASPLAVIKGFILKTYETNPDGATLFEHILTSLQVSLSGFLAGVVIGVPLGIAMAWYDKFDRVARPVFDLVKPIPPIAWIPLMILWLGIGLPAKAAIIFFAAFIPCVINSYTGIKQTHLVHIWVAETFGASKFEILRKVAFPSSLPNIFTGLKVALGNSWMALVAAELLAASRGLGYMIQLSRSLGRPDLIVVGMLTIGGIGALLSFVLNAFENKYVKGGV
jgi:ABC-type nitrate/sulfonate/bicarbonate transport system permease component